MPLSSTSLKRLEEIHPSLAERAKIVSLQFESAFPGYTAQISQALRDWNYQAALYAQGRQTTEQVNALRAPLNLAPITDAQNKKVTDAPPGKSNHNYGFAVDWDIQDQNGILDWNSKDPRWQKLISLADPNGLRSGQCWGDKPHMELYEVPEVPTDDMAYTLQNHGIEVVWQGFVIA